jgi:hypothetical protein
MRMCYRCRKEKTEEGFYIQGNVCKECIRERSKIWRQNNHDYFLQQMREYRAKNRDSIKARKQYLYWNKYKTSPTHHIYNTYRLMKWRSQTRKTVPLKDLCSKEEFIQWSKKTESEFIKLFNEWIESKCEYRMVPSIDRIDSTRGYSIDNLQWLTQRDNRLKQ